MLHHFLWKKEKKKNHILIRRRVPSIEPQANNYRHSDLSHFLVEWFKGLWLAIIMIKLMSAGLYYFRALTLIFLSSFFFLFTFFFSFLISHGKISKWKRHHTFTSALTLLINLISKIGPLHKKIRFANFVELFWQRKTDRSVHLY